MRSVRVEIALFVRIPDDEKSSDVVSVVEEYVYHGSFGDEIEDKLGSFMSTDDFEFDRNESWITGKEGDV